MIFDALMSVALESVTFVLNLLPDYTPGTFANVAAVRTLIAALQAMDNWLNVPALLAVIGLWVTVEVITYSVIAIQWVYGLIPFKAT